MILHRTLPRYSETCAIPILLALYSLIIANTTSAFLFSTYRKYTQPSGPLRSCDFKLEFSDVHLKTPEIAAKYDLPFEAHTITSEDGYIQELHRFPNPGKPPVLLTNGFFLSSRDFLLNCDRRAAVIRFFDEGFDVWASNVRGNTYSRKHVRLSTKSRAYWDFGVDEIVKYDVPATIDYILNATGYDKLNWVGYSMGNGLMFGLLSSRPEYNAKINLGMGMGAAAVLKHTRALPIRIASRFHVLLYKLLSTFTRGEVPPSGLLKLAQFIYPYLCLREIRTQRAGICSLTIALADGPDPLQVDPRVLAMWLAGAPSSLPAKGMTQWFQWIRSGNFSYFDYGPEENLNKYSQTYPPIYDIKKVTSPLVYFYGENDFFTTPQDVGSTIPLLTNIRKVIRVNSSSWNHIDYMVGRDADIHVYNIMIDYLKDSYNNTV